MLDQRFIPIVVMLTHSWVFVSGSHLLAQPIEEAKIVVDLAQSEVLHDGLPGAQLDHAVVDASIYFRAYDSATGEELWVSDGTPEGTRLVADICPGACSSRPVSFAVAAGRVFFYADDGVQGLEPWITDGHRTLPLVDAVPGPMGTTGLPTSSTPVGDAFYFVAGTTDRQELWRTGGTRASTRRVAVLCQATPGEPCDGRHRAKPFYLTGTDQQVFFIMAINSGQLHLELWTSDGTQEGTRMLVDDCRFCNLEATLGSRVFFTHGGPTLDRLWVSDATAEGTHPLLDDCEPSLCADSVVAISRWHDSIYFSTDTANSLPKDLYRTDGTSKGTSRVLDGAGLGLDLYSLIPADDHLYLASRPSTSATIWQFDESNGIQLVVPRVPIRNLQTGLGDRVTFRSLGPEADELWIAGPGPARAEVIASFSRAPQPGWPFTPAGLIDSIAAKGRIFLRAHDDAAGWELWTSDGTANGTVRPADLGTDRSSNPGPMAQLGDRIVFDVERADIGGETWNGLWRSGGSADSTEPLAGGPESAFRFATADAGLIVSSRRYWENDAGLWRINATGQVSLLEPDLGRAQNFVQIGEQWLFSASGINGDEFWMTQGDPAGATNLLLDISPGLQPSPILPSTPNSSSPRDLTRLGSRVLFSAGDADFGLNRELWQSDGTSGGTTQVADICAGECQSSPTDLLAFQGQIFFAADDGVAGRELWRSNGTQAGTRRVLDLVPGSGSSSPHQLFALGRRLFFFTSLESGARLWSTDGTAPGTRPVHDLRLRLPLQGAVSASLEEAGKATSQVLDLEVVPTASGPRAYFVAVNALTGPELWTTDGTRGGTRLLTDLWPGPRGSYPESLTVIDGSLIFAASAPDVGRELWTVDGSLSIRLFGDVVAGPDSSNPSHFTRVDERLFFAADDLEQGRELWSIPLRPIGEAGYLLSGSPSIGRAVDPRGW